MNKVAKAITNAIHGSIYAYYCLSDLEPAISPDVLINGDYFETVWWEDSTGHSTYDPEVAEKEKEAMCRELEDQLKSRNIIAQVQGQVVQEFEWNGKYYELDDHGITYAVVIKGMISDKIGVIYKNNDDLWDEDYTKTLSRVVDTLKEYGSTF